MPISLQEHVYIGLSENPAMENSEKSIISCGVDEKNGEGLNLKATELRLGLPGSESPERVEKNVCLDGVLKGLVSGAKRGFADTINGGSGKWGVGSEVGGLYSTRGVVSERNTSDQSFVAANVVVKDGVVQQSVEAMEVKKPQISSGNGHGVAPAAKAQVVGWPPIRSFRKNSMATNPPTKIEEDADAKSGQGCCLYVKVSMDGAPYLRKIDLNTYRSYKDLSSALEKMFSCFTIGQCGTREVPNRDGLRDLLDGSEYVLTFEDKDGDWMLVGDVPWEMFTETCKKLRIMKSSDAIGLAPRATEKCKTHN